MLETYPTFPITELEFKKTLFEANISHNLNTMSERAGLYEVLWRPEEIGITVASQMIKPLIEGLKWLKSDPPKFKAFNPKNGWGNYEGLCDFVQKYLDACTEFPFANVKAWR